MKQLNVATLEALAKVPRVELGCWPTPVQKLAGFEKLLGREGLFIKRDDLNGVGPGGNKVRTLEYLLAKAVADGADTVLASGPAQSNLCTLAACCAKRMGLPAILVHNAAKPEKPVGNALLNELVGAQCVYIGAGTDEFQRADAVTALEEKLRGEGKNPYTVLLGGSTGLGAIGYLPVVAELARQCNDENLAIQHIFVPGGNGGVAAGMVYGNAVLGRPFTIHVISVEDTADVLTAHMQRIIAEMEEIMQIPMGATVEEACLLTDAYMGAGWSQNTPQSAAMVRTFAQTEGIYIENVYTSKVAVAMMDEAEKGLLDGGACFLHTGGFGSLFAQY
ncbi:pyridoxal-phosphate dependent enzyme [Ruminococcaceae bacterium OttesenSCG-928-N02]|nr:pyridoxal-phosphate dependent enzyme [Ruminococcaceae bacterium OttesenSCG-928-N02]